MRVFVAVDPGAELLARVGELLREISPLAPSAKWVEPAGLHITLAFMGEIGEERLPLVIAAASVAGFHRPLTLRIEKGGAFGTRRRPRVLWLGVGGAVSALTAIHRDLEQALSLSTGYVPEDRPFAPHLTLARSRDPRGDPALEACAQRIEGVDFGETQVRELVVYQSELTPKGARYTALARVPLEGIGAADPGR
ncbi:RNA 2',3'-cyclic phosphodiesterase [Sorangium sp. So ce1036]|uniref:RNA 2',3'-cyclic phosphodiesterase n=1 Tax=Sorangium sp. So ce1036 TaxID=3133328 RepID=UPI003F0482D7